jgi:hypothetical protein
MLLLSLMLEKEMHWNRCAESPSYQNPKRSRLTPAAGDAEPVHGGDALSGRLSSANDPILCMSS